METIEACFCLQAFFIALLPLQELEQLGLGESVNLVVREIPVEYQAIQRLMPSLWEEHQPQVWKKTLSKVLLDFQL